jgi:tetratricopeptide (TPR) repeat protein
VRARPFGFLAFAIVVAIYAVSCRSAPFADFTPIQGSSLEERELALDAVALRLFDFRLSPDALGLSAVKAELAQDSELPGLSRPVQARVTALQGEAALLAGDAAAAKSFADKAAGLSDAEEGVYYIRASLQTDSAKRLLILEDGIGRAAVKFRLLCERGEELFKIGRYAEAAQDLDEGLRGLDSRYKDLYGADRDRAFSLAQAVREGGSLAMTVTPQNMDAALTLRTMVGRAFAQTRLLSAFSADAKPSLESVLPALQKAGLLISPDAPPDSPVARKDVAFFLWGIVARTERDMSLLQKYRTKYAASPVQDVPVDAPWFDAVLGVVEREIMDLPDGMTFKPDGPVTGIEYLEMLQRLSKQYR